MKYRFVCFVIFLVLSTVKSVYADSLSDVLRLYGVTENVISIDSFMEQLEHAQESYYDLKDKYMHDEFFRLTERVADEMFVDLPNDATSLETNEKYLHSLINISASLDLIFEAENDYRNALRDYAELRYDRKAFDLADYGLYGVTSDDVNAAVNLVNSVYEQLSTITYRPTIGQVENLASPTLGVWSVSSQFGYRANPFSGVGQEFHNGLDLRAPEGTDVLSVFTGKVMFAGNNGNGLGNYIIVSHSNEFQTLYAHLSKINVVTGEMVMQYQKIGEVGSTGRSTGPHLHLGVFINGEKVDPLRLFGGRS